nr:hypothetical protein [Mycobacterium uberis]
MFTTPYAETSNGRETLRSHARLMRKTFVGNQILCDLILIQAALTPKAALLSAQKMERVIANLIQADLSSEDAFEAYSSSSVHVRGSVVLSQLCERTSR